MLDRRRRRYVTVTTAPSGVVPFRMGHALYLTHRMRPDEIEQYVALSGAEEFDPDVAALGWCNTPGAKFTLVDSQGVPIIAGGYIPHPIEGVFDSWMVGTMDGWEKHWREITKASRWLADSLLEAGARRLQTMCLASREQTMEWYIRSLRMEPDGLVKKLGRGGEDAMRFVRMEEEDDGLAG